MPAVFDENRCTGCGSCVEKCRAGTISLNETGIAFVDKDNYIGPGKCVKACPVEAISVE
jgi:electron transport complex protein RnfB